jgi:hypothetical protein
MQLLFLLPQKIEFSNIGSIAGFIAEYYYYIVNSKAREHLKMIFRKFGRVVLEFYQNGSGLVKIQIQSLNLNYLKNINFFNYYLPTFKLICSPSRRIMALISETGLPSTLARTDLPFVSKPPHISRNSPSV